MADGMDLDTSVADMLRDNAAPAADKIIQMIAEEIQAAAKQNASGRPGPNVETGNLRNSITIETPESGTRRIGPAADYGHDVELGHGHTPGYPFLRPAFDASTSSMQDKLKGVIDGDS